MDAGRLQTLLRMLPEGTHTGCRVACRSRLQRGFSLVELGISISVIVLLLVLLSQILGDTQKVWARTRSRTAQFRDARAAFEAMSRRISQVTLNSYWGYRKDASGAPVLYERQSELHFVCGPAANLIPRASGEASVAGHGIFFQAPLSMTGGSAALEQMDDLMNAWGYYVEFNSDLPQRPDFLREDVIRHPERRRFRLMEFRLPSEKLDLYRLVASAAAPSGPKMPWIEAQTTRAGLYEWFTLHLSTYAEPLADNVLAFLIKPVVPSLNATQPSDFARSINADPLYDTRRYQWESTGQATSSYARYSRHQLPPELQLTLVALEEDSWAAIPEDKLEEMTTQLTLLVNQQLFARPADFTQDISFLQQELTRLGLKHRIFTTAIPLRAARWTTEQN